MAKAGGSAVGRSTAWCWANSYEIGAAIGVACLNSDRLFRADFSVSRFPGAYRCLALVPFNLNVSYYFVG